MRRRASTVINEKQQTRLRLLQFLAHRFTYLDVDGWNKQINGSRVLLNHKPASAEARLQLGDVVTFLCHDLPEPPATLSYRIIYEDQDLLVIDKPAPLPCHPGGRYFRHTLWALLKEERNSAYFSFVNRIDRETSGIVLIAKNKNATRNCQRQFIQRKVEKLYLAVVHGFFPPRLVCRGLLVNDERSPIRHKVRFMEIAAGAEPDDSDKRVDTEFRLLHTFGRFSLIEARPHSGRRHQIRATLAAINFPLFGDKLYAEDEGLFQRFIEGRLQDADRDYLGLRRQALHAFRLSLRHPTGGERLSFHAPLPNEIEVFLENRSEKLSGTSGKEAAPFP